MAMYLFTPTPKLIKAIHSYTIIYIYDQFKIIFEVTNIVSFKGMYQKVIKSRLVTNRYMGVNWSSMTTQHGRLMSRKCMLRLHFYAVELV